MLNTLLATKDSETTPLNKDDNEAHESNNSETAPLNEDDTSCYEADESNNSESEEWSDFESNEASGSQENLSTEQQLDKANNKLEKLAGEKKKIQEFYDHHNEKHAEAQDDSDSVSEKFQLDFLEKLTPPLRKVEGKIEKTEDHVQDLLDLINSLS